MLHTFGFIDDVCNGQFDALQRANRAIPDWGSVLKNNQFDVMHNILSVVGVFWDILCMDKFLYISGNC